MSGGRFIPVAEPVIGERELELVTDAVRSGWISSIGAYVDRFESAFAAYCHTRHAIAVCNGTAAIHLLLHALGIGPGHEVVIPDLTFAATAHAVLQTGATPVFADVDPQSWCLDPEAARRAIGPRTRAIIAVHLYGHPADTRALGALAAEHDLVLVEDAAEAHGATVDGRRVGGLARAGTFSFYGNKVITTGEGGMVTTSDDQLAERLRYLKDHGMSKTRRYYHDELAFNYRITNIQAALGVAQLEQIEAFIEQKRRIAAWYREALAVRRDIVVSPELPGYRNIYWMTSALVPAGVDRDHVARAMREAGIDSRPFFVPMTELPHLKHHRAVGRAGEGCPVAADLSRRGLNLPSSCTLVEEDVRRCAAALLAALPDSR
jgi:perosamine synthetase